MRIERQVDEKVSIVGVGWVGSGVAEAFQDKMDIGFDRESTGNHLCIWHLVSFLSISYTRSILWPLYTMYARDQEREKNDHQARRTPNMQLSSRRSPGSSDRDHQARHASFVLLRRLSLPSVQRSVQHDDHLDRSDRSFIYRRSRRGGTR